jgi:hypothetical protein
VPNESDATSLLIELIPLEQPEIAIEEVPRTENACDLETVPAPEPDFLDEFVGELSPLKIKHRKKKRNAVQGWDD